jgi:hypothetical protein
MTVRSILTVVLLLSLPVSIVAQQSSPRLDLKRLNHDRLAPAAPPAPAPFRLAVRTVRQNQFTRPPSPQLSCDESTTEGRYDGSRKPFGKWFLGGLGAGFGTSWAGFAWMPALARSKTREPKEIPADVDAACYTAGFLKTSKRNSTLAALLGTGIGAVLLQTFFVGWD